MIMCHMLSPDLDELHAMAAKLGLKREWFQGDASTPHYDVNLTVRAKALELGAVEIDRRQTVALIKQIRAERLKKENDNG